MMVNDNDDASALQRHSLNACRRPDSANCVYLSGAVQHEEYSIMKLIN